MDQTNLEDGEGAVEEDPADCGYLCGLGAGGSAGLFLICELNSCIYVCLSLEK
jgi:hypothetical protein